MSEAQMGLPMASAKRQRELVAVVALGALAAFACTFLLNHSLFVFTEGRYFTLESPPIDILRFSLFPILDAGGGRLTGVAVFELTGGICGADSTCTNAIGALLIAGGAGILIVHTYQLTRSLAGASTIAVLWTLSPPVLGLSIWQSTWTDIVGFITALAASAFFWEMFGRREISPRWRIGVVIGSVVLLAIAFNGKELNYYLVGALPIIAVVRGSGIPGAVRRNLVLTVLPLLYAGYFITYALANARPWYTAQIGSGSILANLPALVVQSLGLSHSFMFIPEGGATFELLITVAILLWGFFAMAIALGISVAARSFRRPITLPGAEVYLLAVMLVTAVVNARSAGASAYYMSIPYWAFLALGFLLLRQLATMLGAPRFALGALVTVFAAPALLGYVAGLTENSAYGQLLSASQQMSATGATIREALTGRLVTTVDWRTEHAVDWPAAGGPPTAFYMLRNINTGHAGYDLWRFLVHDPTARPTVTVPDGTAVQLRGRAREFSKPGEVLVVTADDYRLLLLAYDGNVIVDNTVGYIDPLTSGGSIDALTSVAEYEAGTNATLSVVADAPPGTSGDSFYASIAGLDAGAASMNSRAVTLDLSAYGDAASFSLWVKSSSLDNLGAVYLLFWSANGWVAYDTMPGTAGTWQEFVLPKASPPASGGSLDWSAIDAIYLRVDASANGSYTGDLIWRDLRVGQ